MTTIFISYRRDDTEGQAGRLFDDLVAEFGENSVFIDVIGIAAGRDFRRIIDQHVSSCDVLLAVIGKQWLGAKNESGERRIDVPTDFVCLEIAAALKRDIPVIPILVQKASMPSVSELPSELAELAYRNGLELTHARWDSDVRVLIKALRADIKSKAIDGSSKESQVQKIPTSRGGSSGIKLQIDFQYLLKILVAIFVMIAVIFRPELIKLIRESGDPIRFVTVGAAEKKVEADRITAENAAAERKAAEREVAKGRATEKAERPLYHTGDSFTIRTIYDNNAVKNNITERTLDSMASDNYQWSSKNIDTGRIRRLKLTPEGNVIGAEGSADDYSYSPPLKYFDFPLFPGKKWKQDTTKTFTKSQSQTQTHLSAKVGDWEEISVVAGKFRAIRIDIDTTLADSDGNETVGKDISWYAPEVHKTIKSIVTSGANDEMRKNESELISYSPGQP